MPPKIDLHTHILPRNIPNFAERFGYGGFVQLVHNGPDETDMFIDGRFFRKVAKNCYCCDARTADMDATEVNVQVLSTVPVMFSYWAQPEHGAEVARFLNDDLAETVRKNPRKFIGLGTLPMQAPELAVKELERCVLELGFAGVQIGTHINAWNLNDEQLHPIYETAERLGASIFVHPWDMMGKGDMEKYWLPWLVGMPAESSRAICSMIFGGIFDKYPNLKVAFAHGGGSFPATIGRVEHGHVCRPDLCAVDNPNSPRSYCGRFYVDSLVHDDDMLKYLVKLFGSNRVMLGSDYPFPLGEQPPWTYPGKLVEKHSELSSEDKEQILFKTALEFLGVERSDLDLEESQKTPEEPEKDSKEKK